MGVVGVLYHDTQRGASEGGGVVVSRAATCLWIPQAKSVSCYSSWLHGTAGGNFAGKKAWKGCSYGTPALKVLVCLQHST